MENQIRFLSYKDKHYLICRLYNLEIMKIYYYLSLAHENNDFYNIRFTLWL